jgi:hypothetical protein
MIVLRPEPPAAIHFRCSTCADEGVISSWVDSPHDLRRRGLALAGQRTEIAVTDEVASVLRDLRFLDTDSERVVFGMRAGGGGRIVLAATDDELDELVGLVAAEANHETNRRRQQRLDAAFDALSDTGPAAGG